MSSTSIKKNSRQPEKNNQLADLSNQLMNPGES
jgi:hypothetical protein